MSIALYKVKMKNNVTRDGHKNYSRVFSEQSKFPCLDVRTVHKIIRSATGVAHVSYDVCVNNCVCFVKYPEQHTCPSCGEARYHRVGLKDVPRKTFDYIPVQHRLRLLYSDPKMARQLKSYRKMLEDTADASGNILRDFWDAKLCAELKKKGILTDPRSLAFYFSTDRVYLFRKGRQHTVYPLILINCNLHPELRFRTENIICLGIIPGPKKPKDLHSFLHPIVDEFKLLAIGVPALDASMPAVRGQPRTQAIRGWPAISQAIRGHQAIRGWPGSAVGPEHGRLGKSEPPPIPPPGLHLRCWGRHACP